MKEIIELPEQLLKYIKDKGNELAIISCLFFEFILTPRDNYIPITPEMKPKITDKMLSYIVQNILGVVVNSDTKYTINFDVFTVPELNTQYPVNDIFLSNMSEKLKNTMSYLDVNENKHIITTKSIGIFKEYIEHVLNEALLVLSEGDMEMEINSIMNKHKNILTYLEDNLTTDGDNTLFPKDFGFIDDTENIIVQTFVWLLCGLNDWLDKDYIEEEDVKYMSKILFSSLSSDMLNGSKTNEDIKIKIKSALFLSDFYVSEKAGNLMSKLFSNIKENYGLSSISKRIRQLSIVI
jgi:hypothetical protein